MWQLVSRDLRNEWGGTVIEVISLQNSEDESTTASVFTIPRSIVTLCRRALKIVRKTSCPSRSLLTLLRFKLSHRRDRWSHQQRPLRPRHPEQGRHMLEMTRKSSLHCRQSTLVTPGSSSLQLFLSVRVRDRRSCQWPQLDKFVLTLPSQKCWRLGAI